MSRWVGPATNRVVVGAPLQRLKTRSQFQAVLAGRIVARTDHFALHRLALDAPLSKPPCVMSATPPPRRPLFGVCEVWMGVVTPKRWVAHAVRRNAIKRQVYAVSSAYQAQLPAAAHVVRIHRAFNKQRFVSATSDALKAQLRQELQQLFAKALAVLPQARDTQTGSFEGAKQGG